MEACTSRLPLRPVQSSPVGRIGGGRDSIHLFSKPQCSEFLTNSHLTYYNHGLSITCDGKKDAGRVISKGTVKKKLKLLKGLSTDLSMYTKMAADGDATSIAMLSDLAQILISQREQMKEQNKEIERKRKEEKKLNTLKTKSSKKDNNSEADSSDNKLKEAFLTNSSSKLVEPIHTNIKGDAAAELFAGRIDVCMGGKCKKFGAVELLDQLQKKIGVQGAVVGCKCMGMCKNAPNVRVSTNSVTGPENPINITGVGLEDVDMIGHHMSKLMSGGGKEIY